MGIFERAGSGSGWAEARYKTGQCTRHWLGGKAGLCICQLALVGHLGGEVCWEAWSLGKGQGPMILKPVGLLSVFLYSETKGNRIGSSLAFHRPR